MIQEPQSLTTRNPKALTLDMEAENALHALSLDATSDVVTKQNEIHLSSVDIDLTIPARELKESELRGNVRCILEDFKPCSKSHLWKLMMSFYDRKGPGSWSEGIVPHFITCNTFIGRSYAKVLHGFIQDCMRKGAKMQLNTEEPLYIIELGVGSGKFTYFMLKALEEMKDVCDFPFDKIVYVMTDFTENNYNFWMNHPALKPYFDSGRLDAGIFDAVNDDNIKLHFSGKTLEKNTLKNPICIVANYLFDTLYHDIFQVEAGGVLKEGLVSVGSRNPVEPDPLDPEIISRLDNEYKYQKISASDYYNSEDGDEPFIRRILKWYQEYFKTCASGASILLPIGALRALRKLCRFSSGRAIVISGDKGNNNPDQFIGLMDPHIAVHGSFSLMVNYHAIGAWFTNQGGFTLNNPQEEASLKVGCFVLQPSDVDTDVSRDHEFMGDNLLRYDEERAKSFPYLKQAFEDFMNSFGPNDFFVMQKSLKEDINNPPLRTVISILKLSDWDPDVFFKFRDVILNQAPTCGVKLRNDLSRGIPRVWKNYYVMDLEKDIAFEIGRYYYGVRNYEEALKYYSESVRTIGDHHVTYHNQGLCQYSLGKLEVALELFKKALELSSEYEKARSWIEKVNKELALKANIVTSSSLEGSSENQTSSVEIKTGSSTETDDIIAQIEEITARVSTLQS